MIFDYIDMLYVVDKLIKLRKSQSSIFKSKAWTKRQLELNNTIFTMVVNKHRFTHAILMMLLQNDGPVLNRPCVFCFENPTRYYIWSLCMSFFNQMKLSP
jgi:hypothetical protein